VRKAGQFSIRLADGRVGAEIRQNEGEADEH
jgi:hypothetical protein